MTNITISWDTPRKTVLRYDLNVNWNWDDFTRTSHMACAMMRAAGHEVSVIINLLPGGHFPTGGLTPIRQMLAYTPDNLGVIVVVSDDAAAHYTVKMLSKFDDMLSGRIALAATLDEGRALLRQFQALAVG
jgi:hypothetical protein